MNHIAIINPKDVPPEISVQYTFHKKVRIVCQKDDGMIPLLRLRPDGKHSLYGYMLPGGGVDGGEEPLTAAHRELKEETGCVGKDFQLLGAVEEIREFNQTVRLSYVYFCKLESVGDPEFTQEEIEEETEIVWVTPQQALGFFNQAQDPTSPEAYVEARERGILSYYFNKITNA